jgi:hypothetical protein
MRFGEEFSKRILGILGGRGRVLMLFENGEREFTLYCNQMSGNLVRIRNGCATVTGYKLPRPLSRS